MACNEFAYVEFLVELCRFVCFCVCVYVCVPAKFGTRMSHFIRTSTLHHGIRYFG